MVDIYAVSIKEEIQPHKYETFLSYISDTKLAKIQRFRFKEDQMRSLYGEVIVRSMAIQTKHIENKDILFAYNDYGKPMLKNFPDFHFNLSHSGNWVVVAVSNQPVGVDVEQIKSPNLDIAQRFFSPMEYGDLMEKTGDEQCNYFYDLWTLKESYVKWVGKGLSIPMDSFYFTKQSDFFTLHPANEPTPQFHTLPIDPDYRLSVCTTTVEEPKLSILCVNELM